MPFAVRIPLLPALQLLPVLLLAQGGTRSSEYLARLPDGEEKRRFILDCTGCHQFDSVTVGNRARAEWAEATQRMLSFAGATTGFPVISSYRDPERTADWLTRSLAAATPHQPAGRVREGRADVTEFQMSTAGDLLHDVAVDSTGRVIVTGMFSHRMLVLTPSTGRTEEVAIPGPPAQPRAVELDSAGNWWVLLGGPRQLAKYDVRTRTWRTWDLGMYPHSVALDKAGNGWFNGHFSVTPELIGQVSGDRARTYEVPPHPTMGAPGGPVPYEVRLGGDGKVWMSELQGNRVISFDPGSGRFRDYTLPQTFSGPRRLDVGRDGTVWIPAYSGNALFKLDPASGRFTEYRFPEPDVLPYVARVAPNGIVWIGTAAADRAYSFDPQTSDFTAYNLPSRGALVRHIAIDPRSGEVWLAYGASPGRISARIARLKVR